MASGRSVFAQFVDRRAWRGERRQGETFDGPGEVCGRLEFTERSAPCCPHRVAAGWIRFIRRLLQSPLSMIYGRPAAEWIVDHTVSAQRRACA